MCFQLTEEPNDPSGGIEKLGHDAAHALHGEDAVLRTVMNPKKFGTEPRGLTYWLYETTLVYVIFKAWARSHDVKWDWEPVHQGARGAPQHLDLWVKEDGCELGFEAKWWNTDAARPYLEHDASKLRRWMAALPAGRSRGSLMTFWWCDDELDRWKQEAIDWATKPRRELVYHAWFSTLDRTGSPSRTFVLMLIEIMQ